MTGGYNENIMSLAGVNPFTPELEVKVTKEYACADSIQMLVAPINLMPQVSDVKVHNELIDSVNHTLHSVSLTLVCIAVALLVVSFVLIFNTVRLSVYSKRFLINTMQLVGATSAMIIIGMVICLVAAVFACNRYLSLSYDELYK